jgi:chemosensory pili system protein ChpE
MMVLFVSAFALGIAFSAPPGAVSAEVWRRDLADGFRPAFLVAVGSLLGDAVWAMVALAGAAFIVVSEVGWVALGIAGAIVLMTLALQALASVRRPRLVVPTGRAAAGHGHFATGVVISLAKPYAVAFWVGAGGGVSGTLAGGGREGLGVFFGGFMLGTLLWALLVSALIGWAHRHRTVVRALGQSGGRGRARLLRASTALEERVTPALPRPSLAMVRESDDRRAAARTGRSFAACVSLAARKTD